MPILSVTLSPNVARGRRALGAMFFFEFGGAWLAFGFREALASSAAAIVVIAVLTIVFFLLALRVYRANAPAMREAAGLPSAKRRNRLFH